VNAERRPTRGGAANVTAGRRSSSIVFQPADVRGCIRVDLSEPSNGVRWESGEVGRRLYHAAVGIPTGAVLQIVVSATTPDYDPQLPEGLTVQIVAPDGQTLTRWMAAASGGRE
jgi:hypothetical protein